MDNFTQLSLFLSAFAVRLPVLIVCLVGCIVVLAKWNQASRGALWALLGFGLILFLCVAVPISQTIIQRWMMEGGNHVQRAWAFTALGIVSSVLHAVAYGLLLAAVFAGRPVPHAGNLVLPGSSR